MGPSSRLGKSYGVSGSRFNDDDQAEAAPSSSSPSLSSTRWLDEEASAPDIAGSAGSRCRSRERSQRHLRAREGGSAAASSPATDGTGEGKERGDAAMERTKERRRSDGG
ncbi:unnamed protein product [Lampetra fluviatilis]